LTRPAISGVHDIVASTASHPNVRDDREPPLFSGIGWRKRYHIILKNRRDIFEGSTDDPDQLDTAREFGFLAQPISSRRSDHRRKKLVRLARSGESRASIQVLGCFRFRGKKHIAALAAGSTWSRMTRLLHIDRISAFR